MSTETLSAERATPARSHAPTAEGRGWAFAGLAAGITGLVGIMASIGMSAVYDEDAAGDASAIVELLQEQTGQLVVFHVATVICALLVPLFAAGLHRRLTRRLPEGSSLPLVAVIGLVLVSVTSLIGSGMDTELLFGASEEGAANEGALVMMGHWIGTIPFLWAGAGLAAAALAVAALKHGAASRWIGWVSAILGALTIVAAVSPLQYMAGFVGPLWLIIAGLGFSFGRRSA